MMNLIKKIINNQRKGCTSIFPWCHEISIIERNFSFIQLNVKKAISIHIQISLSFHSQI
jgi:hypothetical protein